MSGFQLGRRTRLGPALVALALSAVLAACTGTDQGDRAGPASGPGAWDSTGADSPYDAYAQDLQEANDPPDPLPTTDLVVCREAVERLRETIDSLIEWGPEDGGALDLPAAEAKGFNKRLAKMFRASMNWDWFKADAAMEQWISYCATRGHIDQQEALALFADYRVYRD